MRLILGATLVVVLALVSVLPALPALAQQSVQVTITSSAGGGQSCVSAENCFDPPVLRIAVGTTVEWKNNDMFSHTVTSGSPYNSLVGVKFDSGLIAPEKSFAFTFKKTGTYHYFCEIHPWMKGEIDIVHGVLTP